MPEPATGGAPAPGEGPLPDEEPELERRRLIRKLSASRLVVGEGSAQVHRRGRPTRLYRLTISSALEGSP